MRERVLAFVQDLRRRGIGASVAESLDALDAVATAGVERPILREALAATLVKDEDDRPAFDTLFDEAFPLVGPPDGPGRKRKRRAGGAADVPGGRGRGEGEGRGRAPAQRDGDGERLPTPGTALQTASRAARVHGLMTMPFREFSGRDVIEARALVRALAERLRTRLARRERRRQRGRVDLRRTLRAAVTTGGVPLRLAFRGRRPQRPDLLALCDLSGSVAAASELCLALIAPAAAFFRRVHLFAYVDRLCPVSVEDGHVAPGGPLDLHARSDFGRVLDEVWRTEQAALHRGTVVLILGDARNNRRPPRAEVLRRIRARVQRVVWIVPEPAVRWDTGDSVLQRYAPACDAVVECTDLGALERAVRRLL